MKYSHKIFLLTVIVGLFSMMSFSQKKELVFHSFNSVQLLNGKSTTSASIHSVNGVQYQKFFTGIGIGFDYYYHTSIPLFFETRYDVTGKERKLQIFADAGLHIPYGNKNRKEPYKTGNFKVGRLLAGGFDYFIPVKKDAVVIGIAYSQKRETQMVDNNIWNPVKNRFENVPIKEAYEFNRIWMKLGWVF